jgi:hypothetical protein
MSNIDASQVQAPARGAGEVEAALDPSEAASAFAVQLAVSSRPTPMWPVSSSGSPSQHRTAQRRIE